MNQIKNALFGSMIALAAFSPAQAQSLTSDEREWFTAIQPFYKDAQQNNISAAVGLDREAAAGTSPVAMMFRPESKQCVFVLAVNNNFANDTVQDIMPTAAGKEIARTVSAAHEYGHCVHNIQAGNGQPIDMPKVKTDEAEQLADVFALVWIAKNRPNDYYKAYSFLTKLRKVAKDENHDSTDLIQSAAHLNEEVKDKDINIFEYAVTFMNKHTHSNVAVN